MTLDMSLDEAKAEAKRRAAWFNKPSRWEEFEGPRLLRLPNTAGVYVIMITGLVYYVGQSRRLRDRLENRFYDLGNGETMTPWGKRLGVVVKISRSKRYGEELMREARLIKRLQPFKNKDLRRRYRSLVIRRVLMPSDIECQES